MSAQAIKLSPWYAWVADSQAQPSACRSSCSTGFPLLGGKVVSPDRGLHNRGAFAHGLSSHGVQVRQAGLESPEHIGKCERHGGIIKRAFKRLVKDHNVVGKDDVKVAMLEAQLAKNEFMRVGGFSPTQVGAWTTTSRSRTRVGRGRARSARSSFWQVGCYDSVRPTG